jgi:hypothetical protein
MRKKDVHRTLQARLAVSSVITATKGGGTMKLFEQVVAILLCTSAAYAEPAAGVNIPDNVTRQKITTEKIYANTVFASSFLMPIIATQAPESVGEEKVVGHVSIEAFDNCFYDTSVPPRLVPNPMLELGINVVKGKRKEAGKPAIWQGMETSYQTTSLNPSAGSRPYSEWYVSGVQSNGKVHRPFYTGWDADNHTKFTAMMAQVSETSGFYINRVGDEALLYSFLGSGLATLPNVQVSNDLAVGGSAAFGSQYWGRPGRAQFTPCGQLMLEGYARVRKTLVLPVSGATPGVISPALAQRAVGASGSIKAPVLSFSNTIEQSVYVEIYAPLDIDDSAAVELHALWQPAAGWSSGNCVWKFEYLVKDETADFTAGAPAIIASDTRPTNARDMQKAIFATRLDVHTRQVIMGRFYRDVASDDGDAAAELRCLKIEYTTNRLGETL